MRRRDLFGIQFGRLVVVQHRGGRRWLCRCVCGQETEVDRSHLTMGVTRSCGCLKRDASRRHGRSRSPEYRTWVSMHQRCSNPRCVSYRNYGARGIRVCDRWRDFETFLADMGPRANGMSLDRINNDGNYEPRNCRWATRTQQNGNSRRNRMLTFRGETKCLRQWALSIGVDAMVLHHRLQRGWSIERALTKGVK